MLSLGLGAAPAFGRAGADKSRSTSPSSPRAASIRRPRFGEGSELRFRVDDALDDAE